MKRAVRFPESPSTTVTSWTDSEGSGTGGSDKSNTEAEPASMPAAVSWPEAPTSAVAPDIATEAPMATANPELSLMASSVAVSLACSAHVPASRRKT